MIHHSLAFLLRGTPPEPKEREYGLMKLYAIGKVCRNGPQRAC